jgi:endonuclease G
LGSVAENDWLPAIIDVVENLHHDGHICTTVILPGPIHVHVPQADWVMEHLTPVELSGSAQRSNRFTHDPALPPGADAVSADFSPPGDAPHYDRGHQAPAGDSSFDQRIQNESFYFTNMSPQVGLGFNRAAWRILEENVRKWVLCGHPDLYVITGPIYGDNPARTGANRVAVPAQYFKIVYDVGTGYAVGFVMPNQAIGSHPVLQNYVLPIADIEARTGLDFFSSFDQRRQQLLESGNGAVWGHTGSCSGGGGD